MGGYCSFPVCIAAKIMGIPFIIYENNLILGKTNRYLLPFCKKIFVSYSNLEGIDKKYIHSEKCNIVVQINGKKRSVLSVEKNLKEKKIKEKIKNDQLLKKYFFEKKIIKSIFIQHKIINLIIK